MRRSVLGAVVLVLAGCGGGAAVGGGAPGAQPVVPDAPAPPIAAADEAPPANVQSMLRAEFGQVAPTAPGSGSAGESWMCVIATTETWSADGTSSSSNPQSVCSAPTPEQEAQAKADQERWEAAIRPAAGSEPRVAATLALTGGGTASFVAWTTASGAACWQMEVDVGDGGGGGSPDGPCLQDVGPGAAQPQSDQVPPCDALCLSSSGAGSGQMPATYLLSGTVPAGTEAIRVTTAGGAAATYPLSGPPLPGARDRSIFMLELGKDDWRKLELVEGGAVVRTVEMPKLEAASEDCEAKLGPPQPVPSAGADPQQAIAALRPYGQAMNACLRASGALPSGSSDSLGSTSSVPATTTP